MVPPHAGAIHIWSAALGPAIPAVAQLVTCLSADEQARAMRFVSPRDRDRFVAGRTFVRQLLARYLGGRPQDVPLRHQTHGKPEVEGNHVSFNLAHSGDFAVCAIGPGTQMIGVDLERVTPMTDAAGVARMILSPRERDDLERLAEPQRLRRLFEIWTCKEAALKAIGTGLDRPLPDLEVTFTDGDDPRITALEDESGARTPFWLRMFEPASGFIGVVATPAPVESVRRLKWVWK
jgi:4'-phosphopantetheinyl transferase